MDHRCHIALIRESDGVSAIVMNLPGAGSCGNTEEEALSNVREAISGVIESYGQGAIPWTQNYDYPDNATLMWISVSEEDVEYCKLKKSVYALKEEFHNDLKHRDTGL